MAKRPAWSRRRHANALLRLPIGDIDIATTALPDEVVRRARAAGHQKVRPASSTAP